jgi:phosphatidylserine synthase
MNSVNRTRTNMKMNYMQFMDKLQGERIKWVAYTIFVVLMILSLSLSITDLTDEKHTNKGLPIVTLVINVLVLLLIIGRFFEPRLLQNWTLVIFLIVLGMTFALSLSDFGDKSKDNKGLPTITLFSTAAIIMYVIFLFFCNCGVNTQMV